MAPNEAEPDPSDERPLTDPVAVARRFLAAEDARLHRRTIELDDLRRSLTHAAADAEAASAALGAAWTSRAEALAVIGTALAPPGASMRVCIGTETAGHLADIHRDRSWAVPECTIHSIWPLAVIEDPDLRPMVRERGLAGDLQRVLESPPGSFAVVDDLFVYALAEPISEELYGVLVSDPLIVRMFTRLFDLAWAGALGMRMAASPSGQDDDDAAILALLARGMKDEVIARYVGSSVRTVRRRIAMLMTEVGATTRFELGVAVARRGLVPDEPTRAARSSAARPPPARGARLG